MDSLPGASCHLKLPGTEDYEEVLLFGSSLWKSPLPTGKEIEIEGTQSCILHEGGLLFRGSDNKYLNVKRVKINGE